MATKSHHGIGRTNYRFLPVKLSDSTSDSVFEFDDSDLYTVNSSSTRADSPEFRKSVRSSRFHGNSSDSSGSIGVPSSMPVNVPDWSKILGNEYRQNRSWNHDVDDDDDDDEDRDGGAGRVPPHEYLARTRIASFSVHEGVGRTLKGRDLSRVRNAIWAKTGFQD